MCQQTAELFDVTEEPSCGYDYTLVVLGDPKPQGRPRTRVVQAKLYISELIRNIKTRIGIVKQSNKTTREALAEIITQSGNIDINNWPTMQQVGQAKAQKVLDNMDTDDWSEEIKQMDAALVAANKKAFPIIYEDKKDKNAKQNLIDAVRRYTPKQLLDCPLRVDLHFYLPRPKGHYGTGRNAGVLKASAPTNHTKRPDIDNLRKLVMDAMTGIFWRDDSLVCEGTTKKTYSDRPRTEIYIKILDL